MHFKNLFYFFEEKTYFHWECSCWTILRGQFYSNEKAAAEVLRHLEEDVYSDNKVESWETIVTLSYPQSGHNVKVTDKFLAIMELWESVMLSCQCAVFPQINVTINEKVFP